jgi:hypothetical protein
MCTGSLATNFTRTLKIKSAGSSETFTANVLQKEAKHYNAAENPISYSR